MSELTIFYDTARQTWAVRDNSPRGKILAPDVGDFGWAFEEALRIAVLEYGESAEIAVEDKGVML